jgi:hypothetical protein
MKYLKKLHTLICIVTWKNQVSIIDIDFDFIQKRDLEINVTLEKKRNYLIASLIKIIGRIKIYVL